MAKKIKIVEITGCNQCPFFDNKYYSYNETCTKLDKKNKFDDTILEDCPLEDKEIE
jgi:hypothetical protein